MTDRTDVADWWRTAIIEMEPGRISLRGHLIQDLVGNIGFAPMIWLMRPVSVLMVFLPSLSRVFVGRRLKRFPHQQ